MEGLTDRYVQGRIVKGMVVDSKCSGGYESRQYVQGKSVKSMTSGHAV